MKANLLKCSHAGCPEEGWWGINQPTCFGHYLICTICENPATLFSPDGQLCSQHSAEARGIEMQGAYPSSLAIQAVVTRGGRHDNQ